MGTTNIGVKRIKKRDRVRIYLVYYEKVSKPTLKAY